MAELGECKLIPMVIKVDDSEGVVSSRPYRYSPQKMDIIPYAYRSESISLYGLQKNHHLVSS